MDRSKVRPKRTAIEGRRLGLSRSCFQNEHSASEPGFIFFVFFCFPLLSSMSVMRPGPSMLTAPAPDDTYVLRASAALLKCSGVSSYIRGSPLTHATALTSRCQGNQGCALVPTVTRFSRSKQCFKSSLILAPSPHAGWPSGLHDNRE